MGKALKTALGQAGIRYIGGEFGASIDAPEKLEWTRVFCFGRRFHKGQKPTLATRHT
jgi:hypothetical protein